MATNFLEKLATIKTEVAPKGNRGGFTSRHDGDIYINSQGRLFGITDKHDAYYDIETGLLDDAIIIKVKPSTPTGKDKKGKNTYNKKAFKSSARSTGTPFMNVVTLCNKLFGKDKEQWARDFKLEGEQDGYTYYSIIDENVTKQEISK